MGMAFEFDLNPKPIFFDSSCHNSYNSILKKYLDVVKFGEVTHQPPVITSFPRKPKIKSDKFTIPVNKPGKNGINEQDRNDVIYRYRQMKSQGKFK